MQWFVHTFSCAVKQMHQRGPGVAEFMEDHIAPRRWMLIGMRLLCRNNFGNNRMEKELRIIWE